MATRLGGAFLFGCTLSSLVLAADDKLTLREQSRPGDTAVVTLEYKANGELQASQRDKKSLLHKMTARARIVFEEKTLPAGETPKSSPRRALRYYTQSAVESSLDDKRSVADLRQSVRLIVCELRDGKPFLFSPSGPLTSEEFSLLEADAALDTLVLGDLLPTEPVAVGDKWTPSDLAVAAVFNLSAVTTNAIEAKLEKADAAIARVTLSGKLTGTASGATTQQSVAGHFVFDRQQAKITDVELTITEERGPSPIAWGLNAQAGFTLRRKFNEPIKRLNDEALAKLPTEPNEVTAQLVYVQPDGQFRFYLPRAWHVGDSSPRSAVMTMLDGGEFISECHVLAAPTVAAGTHMAADEFRNQVERALGNQFQRFLQEGEVPAPKGYFIYRLAVAGVSGGKPTVWYYHLAAGPQGHQLVFIFRLDPDQIDRFGALDVAMVSSIEFEPPRTVSNKKDQ